MQKLDYKRRLAVQKLIEANGELIEDGQFWRYNLGWNDHRVALETNATLDQVVHTRSETFAKIKRGPGANGLTKTKTSMRLAQLEQETANLKQRVRHLEEAITSPSPAKPGANSGARHSDPEKH